MTSIQVLYLEILIWLYRWRDKRIWQWQITQKHSIPVLYPKIQKERRQEVNLQVVNIWTELNKISFVLKIIKFWEFSFDLHSALLIKYSFYYHIYCSSLIKLIYHLIIKVLLIIKCHILLLHLILFFFCL